MTTYTQTNTLYSFLSDDNNKSLIISQDGLILKSNLLSDNPIETNITPSGISDVKTGNSITMERLTYLPTGLAALEAPPNSKTLHIQNTLLVDKIEDLNSTTVNFDNIVLTDGTTTNIINKNGYTTTNTTANAIHYLNFSDNLDSGISNIKKTLKLSCNPSTNTITANTFNGDLFGTATNATTATNTLVTSDNTSGTYYIPFCKTSGTDSKPLYINDTSCGLTYNPNTSTLTAQSLTAQSLTANSLTINSLTANSFNITGTPSTANVACTFGQVGLVKLKTVTGTITGSDSVINFQLTSCFNSSYRNYRIIISSNQVSFAAFPSYSLRAFLGSGTLPTTASLYGVEMKSNSSTIVSPVYISNATIANTPLVFVVSSIPNNPIIFDIKNVGSVNSLSNQVTIQCKSEYNNQFVQGISDRTITTTASNGCTITGLILQQTPIGLGNNMNWSAIIYGYNCL